MFDDGEDYTTDYKNYQPAYITSSSSAKNDLSEASQSTTTVGEEFYQSFDQFLGVPPPKLGSEMKKSAKAGGMKDPHNGTNKMSGKIKQKKLKDPSKVVPPKSLALPPTMMQYNVKSKIDTGLKDNKKKSSSMHSNNSNNYGNGGNNNLDMNLLKAAFDYVPPPVPDPTVLVENAMNMYAMDDPNYSETVLDQIDLMKMENNMNNGMFWGKDNSNNNNSSSSMMMNQYSDYNNNGNPDGIVYHEQPFIPNHRRTELEKEVNEVIPNNRIIPEFKPIRPTDQRPIRIVPSSGSSGFNKNSKSKSSLISSSNYGNGGSKSKKAVPDKLRQKVAAMKQTPYGIHNSGFAVSGESTDKSLSSKMNSVNYDALVRNFSEGLTMRTLQQQLQQSRMAEEQSREAIRGIFNATRG